MNSFNSTKNEKTHIINQIYMDVRQAKRNGVHYQQRKQHLTLKQKHFPFPNWLQIKIVHFLNANTQDNWERNQSDWTHIDKI